MRELPFIPKRGSRRKVQRGQPRKQPLEERLRERLEDARIDFLEARSQLTSLVHSITSEIQLHLTEYAVRNVLREIKKDPARFNQLSEEQQKSFHDEINQTLKDETTRIVAELKDNPEWYDAASIFLNEKSKAWKIVKSVDNAVNRVVRKYGLGQVNTAGWTWLSESLNDIAVSKFPTVKKLYIEKKKNLEYMEKRVEEEMQQGQLSQSAKDLII
ncbi:MAG: hypothetical protein AB1546_16465 [bacterium]